MIVIVFVVFVVVVGYYVVFVVFNIGVFLLVWCEVFVFLGVVCVGGMVMMCLVVLVKICLFEFDVVVEKLF